MNQAQLLSELAQVLRGDNYRVLMDYLRLELSTLKNIDNVQEYSKAVDQAIELKAQKKAYKKLAAIIDNIQTIAGPKAVTPKPGKNDYGL